MTTAARRVTAARAFGWPDILVSVLLVVACGLLVVKATDVAGYDAAVLDFPFQVDDAEGVVLAEATLITEGTNPYARQPSPASYFYAGPYTPLYTLLNAGAVAATGPTFKFGRAVQLVSTLVVAAWLAWAAKRSAKGHIGWLVGAVTGGLFVTAHLVALWSVRVRPDMTALALNLAGVVVLRQWFDPPPGAAAIDRWPRGSEFGTLVCGAALFALGWWTKQTFFAVPVAFISVTTLAWPRRGAVLAALYACMIAIPFAALTAITRGGFAQKTIGYQGSWQWVAFQRLARPFGERYGIVLIAGVVAALVLSIMRCRPTFAACWLALTALLALGAGTSGGNHNHFVELLAASSFAIGQAAAATIALTPASQWRIIRGAPVMMAVALLLLASGAAAEREEKAGWLVREYHRPTESERQGLQAVASYLANAPAPIYSNNVGILVVARQPVRITDPFTMAAEVRLGRWDDADLVADVAAGRYSVIAVSYNDVAALDPDRPPTDATPGLIRAIQARYRLVERNVLRLYVPK